MILNKYKDSFLYDKRKTSSLALAIFIIAFPFYLYLANFWIINTYPARLTFILSEGLLNKASFSIIINFILFFYIFLILYSKIRLKDLGMYKFKIISPTIIFFGVIILLTLLELIFGQDITAVEIYKENSQTFFVNSFIYDVLVAFNEEILIRGFLLTQLIFLFKERKYGVEFGIILSSIIFALNHIPIDLTKGGIDISHLIFSFVLGVLFSIIFVKTNNLYIVIALHFIADIPIIFLDRPVFYLFFILLLVVITLKINGILQKTERLKILFSRQ